MKLDDSRANLIIEHLNRLKKIYPKLNIVETGTIRNVDTEYILGDGHSTHLIAEWIKNDKSQHDFISIDLNTQVAKAYLKKLGLLDEVILMEGNSTEVLLTLGEDFEIHLAYLDSANDPNLILAEFKIIENKIMPEGVVIVDDCVPGDGTLLKGNLVIPYAESKYKVNLKKRQGVIWFTGGNKNE